MRYLITTTAIFIFSIYLGSASANSIDPITHQTEKPVQVESVRQSLQNNIFKILDTAEEANSNLQSDIDARMEIDQRYFQNRFKILSNETPILYKLYT